MASGATPIPPSTHHLHQQQLQQQQQQQPGPGVMYVDPMHSAPSLVGLPAAHTELPGKGGLLHTHP
jgi:hypothetical protein